MTTDAALLPAARPRRIGIICGGGGFPLRVAEAARRAGMDVLLVALRGIADPALVASAEVCVHVGEIGRIFRALEDFDCREVVLVGSMRRPAFREVKLDWTGLKNAAQLSQILRGGDDQVLMGVIAFIEGNGFTVLGVRDVAPALLFPAGALGRRQPSAGELRDIALARRVLAALGPFDVGQAIAVADGHVLAVEAAEGTDEMLQRVAGLRAAGKVRGEGGCLVKMAKPTQDLRVDLPAVGPTTILGAAEARLAGIALEAGRSIAGEREALAAAADTKGLYLFGFPSDAA